MIKKTDSDILALKKAKQALLKSSSLHAVIINLSYLQDYFVTNPPKDLEDHWKAKEQEKTNEQ